MQVEWLRQRDPHLNEKAISGLLIEFTSPTAKETTLMSARAGRRRCLERLSQNPVQGNRNQNLTELTTRWAAKGVPLDCGAKQLLAWAVHLYADSIGFGCEVVPKECSPDAETQLQSYAVEKDKVVKLLTGDTEEWVNSLSDLLFSGKICYAPWMRNVQAVLWLSRARDARCDWVSMITHNMLPGPGREFGAILEQALLHSDQLFLLARWTRLQLVFPVRPEGTASTIQANSI